jgi:hypothetical protein
VHCSIRCRHHAGKRQQEHANGGHAGLIITPNLLYKSAANYLTCFALSDAVEQVYQAGQLLVIVKRQVTLSAVGSHACGVAFVL